MSNLHVGLILGLTLSIIYNFYLVLLCSTKNKLIKELKKSPPKESTYDVKALLSDLLQGTGLIKVSRIAPEEVFLKSPRA